MLGTLQNHPYSWTETYRLKSSAAIASRVVENMQQNHILWAARMKNYKLEPQSLFCCNASHHYHYIHPQSNRYCSCSLTFWKASAESDNRQANRHNQHLLSPNMHIKSTNKLRRAVYGILSVAKLIDKYSALHILLTSFAFTSALAPIRSSATGK